MLSFEDFRAYARIDDPSFDESGEAAAALLCYNAAIASAKGYGIPVERLEQEDNAKLELFIYALAGHFYDNRNFTSSTQSYTGDQYTQRMMTRMQIELESEGW